MLLEFNEDNDLKKHIADNHIEGAISPRPYLLCKYCSKGKIFTTLERKSYNLF